MIELQYPLIIDGGLSNVLEEQGCDLNHRLWSAHLINTNPEAIIATHLRYIESGAQVIATASYQASITGLMEEGYSHDEAVTVILKSVALAREAVSRAQKRHPAIQPPFIGASIGPYGAYLADGSEYRGNYGLSRQELFDFHFERIKLLDNSSADLLLFETFPDEEELTVIRDITQPLSKPSWVSFSCRNGAELNDGSPVEQAAALFNKHPTVFAIGVNCTKPKYITELIIRIKKVTDRRIVVYPNSGEVYDADSKSWQGLADPEVFVKQTLGWINLGADLVGGCCRVGPAHIAEIKDELTP